MDISNAKAGINDFANFLRLLDDMDVEYEIEDWDNMCGVQVYAIGTTCFNFYEDGTFRAIVSDSEESHWRREQKAIEETLRNMSWWELFKRCMFR